MAKLVEEGLEDNDKIGRGEAEVDDFPYLMTPRSP